MTQPNNGLPEHQTPIQSQKKPWHAVVAALGCGLPVIIASALLLFTVVILFIIFYFGTDETNLEKLHRVNADEILRNIKVILTIILLFSFIIASIAAILGGKTAHRHSGTPRATSRLLTSIFTGLGIGVVMFVIGFIGGLILDPISGDYSFGESAFALMIFTASLLAIFIAAGGGLSGAILVFRWLLKKEMTRIEVKDQY